MAAQAYDCLGIVLLVAISLEKQILKIIQQVVI
jgi:hypothetical protein